ncbi:MAG: hypothetical protein KDG49_16810, partial [Geminicoccaceae bacterium]|nr:hypothetical protein [Geminicoccaceae bacterium]
MADDDLVDDQALVEDGHELGERGGFGRRQPIVAGGEEHAVAQLERRELRGRALRQGRRRGGGREGGVCAA